MKKKVIYTSGPISAKTPVDHYENLARARSIAMEIWAMGAACICPQTNTYFMDGFAGLEWHDWIEGDLEIVRRCDAVFMLPDWETSQGAIREREEALLKYIPVFYNLKTLQAFIQGTDDEKDKAA